MKLSLLALCAALLVSSCNNSENSNKNSQVSPSPNASPLSSATPMPTIKPSTAPDASFKPCNEYFPLVPGSTEKYSILYGTGLQADATLVVDRAPGSDQAQYILSEQIVDTQGGIHKQSLAKILLTCNSGKVQMVTRSEDNKVDDNTSHTEVQYVQPAVAMVEDSMVRPGTRWSFDLNTTFQLPGQKPIPTNQTINTEMSAIETENISVPAGTFTAMKMNRKVGTSIITEYYVRGLGMIKRIVPDGTTWSLKEYSGLKPVE